MSKKKGPVLVTGGSGYIGSWVVKTLLDRGHTVHTTVRDLSNESKVDHLRGLDGASDRLHLFEADLTKEGSFAEAMADCVTVIHVASPFFPGKPKDPLAELVRPAVGGTRNVLETVNATPSVTKVVLTSSVAAVGSDNDEPGREDTPWDETMWNETASTTYQPYSYSKTQAERAAWQMAEAQDRWSLAVINPSFVLGPSLSSRVDGTSASTFVSMMTGQMAMGTPDLQFGIVDVRDVAEAHVRAAENGATGRHILASRTASFVELAKMVKERYPSLPLRPRPLPRALFYVIGPAMGFSWRNIRHNYGIPVKLNNERAKTKLGIEFRDVRETVLDQAAKLISDGLVSVP